MLLYVAVLFYVCNGLPLETINAVVPLNNLSTIKYDQPKLDVSLRWNRKKLMIISQIASKINNAHGQLKLDFSLPKNQKKLKMMMSKIANKIKQHKEMESDISDGCVDYPGYFLGGYPCSWWTSEMMRDPKPDPRDGKHCWNAWSGGSPGTNGLWPNDACCQCGGRCFTKGFKYTPLDMNGQSRSVETNLQACQNRCSNVIGCKYFSYWPDGGCHLQDSSSQRVSAHSIVISGPKSCISAYSLTLPHWDDPSEDVSSEDVSSEDIPSENSTYDPLDWDVDWDAVDWDAWE